MKGDKIMSHKRLIIAILLGLGLAGCFGGDDDSANTTASVEKMPEKPQVAQNIVVDEYAGGVLEPYDPDVPPMDVKDNNVIQQADIYKE